MVHGSAAASEEQRPLPQVILSRLTDPAQRSAFLGDYEGTVRLAVDPSREGILEQVLREWDLRRDSRGYEA
ncbi:hypothetical protein [Nonomuraea endophytica]|uniref:hypothetical protein n=1 Tax=Nonomuraea endophytica TaxID=714136 RepID=UPI0037C7C408